jgi:hypothetical protein
MLRRWTRGDPSPTTPAYKRSRPVMPALKLCKMRAAMSTFARNIRRSFIVSEVGKQGKRAIQEAIIETMASKVHDTVGELRSAVLCASYMPSLKAKKLEKLTREKTVLER